MIYADLQNFRFSVPIYTRRGHTLTQSYITMKVEIDIANFNKDVLREKVTNLATDVIEYFDKFSPEDNQKKE